MIKPKPQPHEHETPLVVPLLNSWEYQTLQQQILHLKEIMVQHDRLTALAIEKSEANYNERFLKTNEFREQQKDIINTMAGRKEVFDAIGSLAQRFEQNMLSATERMDAFSKSINAKIDLMQQHMEEKVTTQSQVQTDKFAATDKQMQTLIDSNAEVSNRGLKELNFWKESTSGSIRVILAVGGFVVAIVLSLIIAYLRQTFFAK